MAGGDCWRHGGPFPRTGTVPSLFVVASLWGMRSQAWLWCKDRRKTHRTLSENCGCLVTWWKWVWAANCTSTGQDSPLKLTALCQASERAGHSQDKGTISRGQRWPVSKSCGNSLTAHSGSEAPALPFPGLWCQCFLNFSSLVRVSWDIIMVSLHLCLIPEEAEHLLTHLWLYILFYLMPVHVSFRSLMTLSVLFLVSHHPLYILLTKPVVINTCCKYLLPLWGVYIFSK